MFVSEVALLKTENETQSKNLREDDRRIIKAIMKSMSVFKVNSYDAQVIRRDLIGMAFEMKLRNSSLDENIGIDVKGFADEIIKNTIGPSMWEIILNFFMKLSGYFFAWFTLLALGAYSSFSWKANPIIYVYFIGVVVVIFVAEGIIAPHFITEKGVKKNLHSLFSMFLLVIFTSIIFLLNDKNNVRDVNGGMVVAVSGLIYFMTQYLNVINIRKLARGKRNFIDDL